VHYKEDDEWKQFQTFPAIRQLPVRSFCGLFPESWSRPFLETISDSNSEYVTAALMKAEPESLQGCVKGILELSNPKRWL